MDVLCLHQKQPSKRLTFIIVAKNSLGEGFKRISYVHKEEDQIHRHRLVEVVLTPGCDLNKKEMGKHRAGERLGVHTVNVGERGGAGSAHVHSR